MNKYEIIRELGRGGEGIVYLIKKKEVPNINMKEYVLKKKVCINMEEASSALQEAMAMAKVDSDFVVKYEDVFLEDVLEDNVPIYHLCIVMEYCSGGDLHNVITELSTSPEIAKQTFLLGKRLREWLFQLASSVYSLHSSKLVHRDIKSENVFISGQQTLKIGDLGEARKLVGEKTTEAAGTFCYSSPELLEGKNYNHSTDLWSLGCVFYELCTLKLLPPRVLAKENEFSPETLVKDFPQNLSDIAKLVVKLLQKDPLQRPPIESVLKDDAFKAFNKASNQSPLNRLSSSYLSSPIRLLLSKQHTKEAAKVLAEALVDDPRFGIINGERKKVYLEQVMLIVVKSTIRRGAVWGLYFASRLIGVSVWLKPDDEKIIPKKIMAKIGLKVAFTTPQELSNVISALKTMKECEHNVKNSSRIEPESWVLLLMGLLPAFQSQNLGKQLLDSVLEWADVEGKIINCWTFNERNLHFFTKIGCETIGCFTPTGNQNLKCWTLKREPQVRDSFSQIYQINSF